MDKRKDFNFNLIENEVLVLAFKLLDKSETLNKFFSEDEVLELITSSDFEEKFNSEFEKMDERIKRANLSNDNTKASSVEQGVIPRGKELLQQVNSMIEQRKELGSALSEIENLRNDYFSTLQYLIDTVLASFKDGKPITFECIDNQTSEKGYLICIDDMLYYEHPNHNIEVLYSVFAKNKFNKIFGKSQNSNISESNNDDDWDK